jgi:ubiquinone biosynthesis protein
MRGADGSDTGESADQIPDHLSASRAEAQTREAGEETEPVSKIQRTVEILRTLQDHNFFQLIKELSQAERERGVRGTELRVPAGVPERMRRLLEDLGPTFIKLGQLMGTRPDLVPKAFADEFRHLYDKTKPTSYRQIKRVVEDELDRPIDDVFATFEREPVARASSGQVHFAELQNGDRVAVKVQHPGIHERVARDFEILEPIVSFVERVFAGSRIWQPQAHLEEMRVMLGKELDYTYEARNHQRVFENFEADPNVKIPEIHWEHSGRRVLTLASVDGIKLEDLDEGAIPSLDGESVAEVLTTSMAEMIFDHRLFHADPSPGNVLILDSNTIAYLDFGAVGYVTRRRAERVLGLLVGFQRDDLEMVAQNLIDLCNKVGPFEPGPFKNDLEQIMEFHDRERASPGNPEMLDMIIDTAEDHNLRLPPDFMLITRSLFQFEGMCRRLDPNYELIETLGPYIQQRLFERYLSPERQKDALIDIGIQGAELVKNAPGRINTILRKLEQDELSVNVELGGLDAYQEHQRGNVLRASLAAITASLLLAVALIMALGRSGELGRFALVAAMLVLTWIFVMIWLEPDE